MRWTQAELSRRYRRDVRWAKRQADDRPRADAAYYRTPRWRELSARILRERPLCERCGRWAKQVHHRHYLTVGRETDADLESLCGLCHLQAHGKI